VQNLIYALIQVIHNFGAATVVGTATAAIWLAHGNAGVRHRLSFLIALAWAIQAASGVMFGATTYYFDKRLPDIHGIAVDALAIKIVCALTGFILAIVYMKFHSGWSADKQNFAWRISLVLGVVALSSAAFLRWFS
jgi:DNA-binding transcriptional regulator YbjK